MKQISRLIRNSCYGCPLSNQTISQVLFRVHILAPVASDKRSRALNQQMAALPNEVTADGCVGFGEIAAYGSGNFAEMMIFNPATTFIVFFFTDIAGIAGNVDLLRFGEMA